MTNKDISEIKLALRENLIEFGLLPNNVNVDFTIPWAIGALASEVRRLRKETINTIMETFPDFSKMDK